MKKTSSITLEEIKNSDGWFELAHDLGLSKNKTYQYFVYGEYATITIEVDEDLNIVGGKIHKIGK